MKFIVVKSKLKIPSKKDVIYLLEDNWDDWFEHSTLYILYYYDDNLELKKLGGIKIGEFQMTTRRPNIPKKFLSLNEKFFSLGQDSSYYEKLNDFGDDLREKILVALNDLSLNNDLFNEAVKEKVTRNSLLRFVSPKSVKGEFHRLAIGEVKLSEYNFRYISPSPSKTNFGNYQLEFSVQPNSRPPSNIHVLIGRNGVGKTHLLNNMIKSLLYKKEHPQKYGKFIADKSEENDYIFANLVSVTFSAFDETEVIPERRNKSDRLKYAYVGLKRIKEKIPKSPTMLKNEFINSLLVCRKGGRDIRWKEAVEILESDPIFKQAEIIKLINLEKDDDLKLQGGKLFKKLSSGHKIVLLTITRLIETVEERSLVIIDEPEAHMHPPLLSAFTRALSNLLIKKNGVSIIATHSPVVLQEVPSNCVWRLRRTGTHMNIERLQIETFGENIGTLTREVFGLEVTESGFHKILSEVSKKSLDYEEARCFFNDKLGDEAAGILKVLTLIENS